MHHKLSAKYYGPFEIEARVGKVAYRLKLPSTAAIYPVFHVSQLKLCHGTPVTAPVLLEKFSTRTLIAVLDRRLGRRNGRPVMNVLIQWSDGASDEATWEVYEDLIT